MKNAPVNYIDMPKRRELTLSPYLLALLCSYLVIVVLVAFYLTRAPQFHSDFSLVLPGTGTSSKVTLDEVGQVSQSSTSAFGNHAYSPISNYKQILLSPAVRTAAYFQGAELTSQNYCAGIMPVDNAKIEVDYSQPNSAEKGNAFSSYCSGEDFDWVSEVIISQGHQSSTVAYDSNEAIDWIGKEKLTGQTGDVDRSIVIDLYSNQFLMDRNANGLPDLDGVNPFNPMLVSGVDAYVDIDVSYQPLAAGGVYEQSASKAYLSQAGSLTTDEQVEFNDGFSQSAIAANIRSGRMLVSVIEDENGHSGLDGATASDDSWFTNTTSYRYKDMTTHSTGYGSLGFSSIETTRSFGGEGDFFERNLSHYLKEVSSGYLLAGKLDNATVWKGQAGTEYKTHEVAYNWKVRQFNAGASPPHYYSYPISIVEREFDLAEAPAQGVALSRTAIRQLNAPANMQTSCDEPQAYDSTNRVVLSDVDLHSTGIPLNTVERQCSGSGNALRVSGQHTVNNNILDSGLAIGLIQDAAVTRWSTVDSVTDTNVREYNYTFDSNGQIDVMVREPNASDNDLKLTTDYAYNVYGNPASITESWLNTPDNGLSFTSRTRQFNEYYQNSKRVIESTNEMGHTTVSRYDPRFDLVEHVVDENALVTTSTYDGFGRSILTTYPDLTSTEFKYVDCDCSDFIDNEYLEYAKTTGQAPSRSILDKFGRQVATQSYGLNGDVTETRSYLNGFGGVDASTNPFRTGAITNAVTQSFDYQRRVMQTDFANSSFELSERSADTNGRVLNQTKLGVTTRYLFDGSNRVTRTVDANNTTVDYHYTAEGQIASAKKFSAASPSVIVETSMQYDTLGRRTLLDDPDMGLLGQKYNALGWLYERTDAENQSTRYAYDQLGRMVGRTDLAGSVDERQQSWVYDAGTPLVIGRLAELSGETTTGLAYQKHYSYDALMRRTTTTRMVNGDTLSTTQHYDSFGRDAGMTYPSGFTVDKEYNAYGYVVRWVDASNSTVLRAALLDDQWGNVHQYAFGNGTTTQRTYTTDMGRIDTIAVSAAGGVLVQDHDYDFDVTGNLAARTDNRLSITESFCYDNLNRLTSEQGVCGAISYDDFGNITSKTSVAGGAAWQYGTHINNGAGPHAVTAVDTASYVYNYKGEMTGRAGTVIDYTSFGKPNSIQQGNVATLFDYAPGQSRIQRLDDNNGQVEITDYFGQYERVMANGTVTEKYYINGFAVYTSVNGLPGIYSYLHTDYLGSTVVITSNDPANDALYLGNDAWGLRRDFAGNSLADEAAGIAVTKDGFTGHEHLDGVGLIHMNGRVYDPTLGRFLSPDPFVQAPFNSQSFNRYSYVWNNPLGNTDPTGYACTAISSGSTLTAGKIHGTKFVFQCSYNVPRSVQNLAKLATARALLAATTAVASSAVVVGSVLPAQMDDESEELAAWNAERDSSASGTVFNEAESGAGSKAGGVDEEVEVSDAFDTGGSESEGKKAKDSSPNEPHANKKRKNVNQKKYEQKRKELQDMGKKPNKTKEFKKDIKKLENEVNRLRQRAEFKGANDSMRGPGGN